MIATLLDGLALLGLQLGIARSDRIYALVSAAHILAIALLLGPVLLADLRLLGRLPAIAPPALRVLRRTAALGAGLAVATGALLFSARPHEYAANPTVWWKLATVALALGNALLFEWRGGAGGGTCGRAAALLSIGLWLLALWLGRWIAFS